MQGRCVFEIVLRALQLCWLHLPVTEKNCSVSGSILGVERIESKCLWEQVCTVTFVVILQS